MGCSYFTDAVALSNAAFGGGSGAIVLDNVACTGSEGSLVSCPYDSHTADCTHSEDASVRCPIATRMLDSGLRTYRKPRRAQNPSGLTYNY